MEWDIKRYKELPKLGLQANMSSSGSRTKPSGKGCMKNLMGRRWMQVSLYLLVAVVFMKIIGVIMIFQGNR